MEQRLVFCIKKQELIASNPSIRVFKTGFRRVGGFDYPLASCGNECHHCNPFAHKKKNSRDTHNYV